MSCKGFPAAFFVAAVFCFFAPCFLALGGVLDSRESSWSELRSPPESSSSDSGLDRFLPGPALDFKVVWVVFLGTAFAAPAAAFLGAALAFGFAF